MEKSQELETVLEARHISPTAMRILVLEILQNSEHAISLNDLESSFDQVDKTTLYRTLKRFEKNKLVHSIDDGSGSVKYALCEDTCQCLPEQAHIHFHCIQCLQTSCMKDFILPSINLPSKFVPHELSMVVKGLCDKCSS